MSISAVLVFVVLLNVLTLQPVRVIGRSFVAFLIDSRTGCAVGILLVVVALLAWVRLVMRMEENVEIVWWILFAVCSALAGWAGMPHDRLSPRVHLLLPDLQAIAIAMSVVFFAGQMHLSLSVVTLGERGEAQPLVLLDRQAEGSLLIMDVDCLAAFRSTSP